MRQHGMQDARRWRAAGLLVALACAMGAATACGCPPRPKLLAKAIAAEWKRSTVIVEAVAGDAETQAVDVPATGEDGAFAKTAREERQRIRWTLSRVWQAPPGTSAELLTDTVVSGEEGGARFEPGDDVVLFLSGPPPYRIDRCTMILPVAQSAKQLRYLERQAARVAAER
jgi:hypothetical protein